VTTLGQRILERVARASLGELARADVLAPDDAPVAEGDAERVADAIESALERKNQFAASEPSVRSGVRSAVAGMFDAIARGEPREGAMARGAAELRAVLEPALGPAPREVTSATYSPELQLAVLGLRAGDLCEPILDVGCGADGGLVRFLRAAGKDARGLDQAAPREEPFVRGDWLAFDYGTAHWGTVVSHLGFSLHFMHQEMKASELAFEYARAYMRIVRSLAPGGTFAYVPGLPFIEAMLPASELQVVRVPLARELVTENVARVQDATGLVLDAATHVVAALRG
jgi:hypothetical protein